MVGGAELVRTLFKNGLGTPITVAVLIVGAVFTLNSRLDSIENKQDVFNFKQDQQAQAISELRADFKQLDLWVRPAPNNSTAFFLPDITESNFSTINHYEQKHTDTSFRPHRGRSFSANSVHGG